MPDVTPIRNPKGDVKSLINAATNPRDKAFISTLGKTAMGISELIKLEGSDIDFVRGSITIVHLKERLKLKCPNCGETLSKRHHFCPGCGNKVDKAISEKVEQRRQRTIPADRNTLRLLNEYLQWRRKFLYRGPLVFPFSRQRGWQLVEKIGRRAGIKGLNPNSLRQSLAARWIAKGLDRKKLKVLLGQVSMATAMKDVDSSFEQLMSEYEKLWEIEQDEEKESSD